MSSILKFIRENHILALIEQATIKKKSTLNLNSYEISEIPNILFSCFDVEHLYLHKNKISSVNIQITQLLNLTTLTLDYNNITQLPKEIGNLKNLVNLNISYNPLNTLLPEIGDLENLEAFWCNRIGLKEIPKEIGKLSKLDTFGARGNELTSLPDEITELKKLRWLTLENNEIDTLPADLSKLEALVHCNFRNNCLRTIPISLTQCNELMYIQLNNNLIAALPEGFDPALMASLEVIDLRGNPICDTVTHVEHPLIRFCESLPSGGGGARSLAAQNLVVQASPLNAPGTPPAPHVALHDIREMEMESDSIASSEDWENSVDSAELDVQYQSDDDHVDNQVIQFLQAVGMVLPELSRFASTAS